MKNLEKISEIKDSLNKIDHLLAEIAQENVSNTILTDIQAETSKLESNIVRLFERFENLESKVEKLSVEFQVFKTLKEEANINIPTPQEEVKAEIKNDTDINTSVFEKPEPQQEVLEIPLMAQQTPKIEKPKETVVEKNNIPEKKTLGEQFAVEKQSLNELFMQQKGDLTQKFQNAKVNDLTKAIGINDKFLFIKELFNNKGEEFNSAITKLNAFASIDEAFDHLDYLKESYFWDNSGEAYLKLCDLLRRKFY